MISSYPMWCEGIIRKEKEAFIGHGMMQGTSMASPFSAGVVATLRQAIDKKQIPYHPLVVKEAVFETGDKSLNSGKYLPIGIGGKFLWINKPIVWWKRH